MEREALEYMIGKEIKYVERDRNRDDLVIIGFEDAEVIFSGEENSTGNDCYVGLEDGFEDLQKMVGETILNCYESINESAYRECDDRDDCDYDCDECEHKDNKDYGTWAFYNIQTLNHDCCLRFHGGSNGYYCEIPSISLCELDKSLFDLIKYNDILRDKLGLDENMLNSIIKSGELDIEHGEYKFYTCKYNPLYYLSKSTLRDFITVILKNEKIYSIAKSGFQHFVHKGELLAVLDMNCVVNIETGEFLTWKGVEYIILNPDK